MRKFLLLTMALVGLTCACQKPIEPEGELSAVGSSTISCDGGSVSLKLKTNVPWIATAPQGVGINPSVGSAGEHDITATVPANDSYENVEYTIEATLTNNEGKSIKKSVVITVSSKPVPAPEIKVNTIGDDVLPFYGGEVKYELEANCAWVAEATEGVVVNPTSGDGSKVEIIATFPANESEEDVLHEIKFTATNYEGTPDMRKSSVIVEKPYIADADGNEYKIVKLADGRIWMAENMRLIPNGGVMTASSDITWLDPAFYCPLVISADGSTVDFSREDEDIKSQGLYYSVARAFGLEDDTQITAENAESFEGCQGICPDGWHIPTAAEMVALVGKCSNKALTDTEAAYYDATLDNGSLEKLNADGANFKAYGAINVANTAAANGAMLKVLNADNSDFNTGYFIGSTVYQITKNKDQSLKNIQYYGFMPNVKNGTMNVAYNNYRNGVSLRCIKNQ